MEGSRQGSAPGQDCRKAPVVTAPRPGGAGTQVTPGQDRGSDSLLTGPLCSPLPLAGPHLPAFTSLHEAALLLPRFSSCPSSTRERGVTAWLPGQQSPGPPTWTLPSLAACRLPSSQPLHIFARLLPPKRLSPHLRQHEGRSS